MKVENLKPPFKLYSNVLKFDNFVIKFSFFGDFFLKGEFVTESSFSQKKKQPPKKSTSRIKYNM